MPPPHAPEGVQCLLYYSDVQGNGGPTMIVPEGELLEEHEWNRDFRKVRAIRGSEDRATVPPATWEHADRRPDLYAREQPLNYRRGAASVLPAPNHPKACCRPAVVLPFLLSFPLPLLLSLLGPCADQI